MDRGNRLSEPEARAQVLERDFTIALTQAAYYALQGEAANVLIRGSGLNLNIRLGTEPAPLPSN